MKKSDIIFNIILLSVVWAFVIWYILFSNIPLFGFYSNYNTPPERYYIGIFMFIILSCAIIISMYSEDNINKLYINVLDTLKRYIDENNSE